jgi:Cu(I)/Ag(I) efflux system periplasmic protein CusF
MQMVVLLTQPEPSLLTGRAFSFYFTFSYALPSNFGGVLRPDCYLTSEFVRFTLTRGRTAYIKSLNPIAMHTTKIVTIVVLSAGLFAGCAKHEQQTASDSTLSKDTAAHVAVKEGQGKGVVLAMDTTAKSITLAHGDIPNIMEGMDMEYHVEKAESLRGVHIGDSVAFTLQDRGDGNFVITRITPIPKH